MLRRLIRNERGFMKVLAMTFIITSIAGYKFGSWMSRGPTTKEEILKTAQQIEQYIKVNKTDIETAIQEAQERYKKQNLIISYADDDATIYQALPDRIVEIYTFNVGGI